MGSSLKRLIWAFAKLTQFSTSPIARLKYREGGGTKEIWVKHWIILLWACFCNFFWKLAITPFSSSLHIPLTCSCSFYGNVNVNQMPKVTKSISSEVWQINCCTYFKTKNETNKFKRNEDSNIRLGTLSKAEVILFHLKILFHTKSLQIGYEEVF